MLELENRRLHEALAQVDRIHQQYSDTLVKIKDVRNQLLESEALNRGILDSAMDCIILMNQDGCILEFNMTAERVFGYGRCDVLGKRLSEVLIPPSLRERHQQGWKRCLENHNRGDWQSRRMETTAMRADGSEFPVELSLTKVLTGDAFLFSGFIRDLTEARQKESKYRTLFEASADAIMLLDNNGFFDCNSEALHIFGCASSEDFLGRHPGDFSPQYQPGGQGSRQLAEERIATALSEGSSRFEWLHKRLDGTEFPAQICLSPVQLEGRSVVQAIVRDIGAQKHTEEKMQQSLVEAEAARQAMLLMLEELNASTSMIEQSRREWEQTFDAVTDPIFLHDRDGRVVRANHAYMEKVGKSFDAIIGTPYWQLFPIMDGPMANCLNALEQATEVEIQEAGNRTFLSHSYTIRDEQGNYINNVHFMQDITEQRQAEARAREHKQRLQAIIESNPVPTIITRLSDGLVRYANEPVRAMFRGSFSADQDINPVGQRTLDYYAHPGERERLVAELREKGHIYGREVEVKGRDGRAFWVLCSMTQLSFDGELSTMAGLYDITKRKRAETALRWREKQLSVLARAGRDINKKLSSKQIMRELVDSARLLVSARSGAVGRYRDGEMIFTEYVRGHHHIPVNYRFAKGYGVPGHIMQTKQSYLSSDATKDPYVIQEIRDSLDFHRLVSIPILDGRRRLLGCLELHDREDGQPFSEQDREMLESLSGIASGAFENALLLDELRESEERAKESLEAMRAVARSTTGIVFQFSVREDGVTPWFPYISDAVERYFGISAERAVADAQTVLSLVHPEDSIAFLKKLRRALKGREKFLWQGRFIGQDEKILWLSISSEPVLLDDGNCVWNGVAMDMTEQHDLELQFLQAQKMEAVGTLAGGIAHDFNNILAGMLGDLYLVRSKIKDRPDELEKLKRVEKAGFRAAEMISQMLTFARKSKSQRHPLLLGPFANEVFKLARASVPENIDLQFVVGGGDLRVCGDESQLQQVILNLIANARYAVEETANPLVLLSLDLVKPDAAFHSKYPGMDDQLVRLTIEDNGCGIPAENIGKLFEPFFTTRKVGKGTGLGLAMVYGAVASHGGVIEVDSALNRGTRIHIYLPLLEQDVKLKEDTADEPAMGGGETLLMVDDDPLVLEVTAELLQSLQYRVLTAMNGREALTVFRQHRADIRLVILDVIMPEMGGLEAARKMRQINKEIPVIFQTGYGEVMEEGFSDAPEGSYTMTKPPDIALFSARIRSMLDETR